MRVQLVLAGFAATALSVIAPSDTAPYGNYSTVTYGNITRNASSTEASVNFSGYRPGNYSAYWHNHSSTYLSVAAATNVATTTKESAHLSTVTSACSVSTVYLPASAAAAAVHTSTWVYIITGANNDGSPIWLSGIAPPTSVSFASTATSMATLVISPSPLTGSEYLSDPQFLICLVIYPITSGSPSVS